MSERMTQNEMLSQIEQEKRVWQDIVRQVGPDRMEQPGVVGDWTFKDFTAHMTGWRDYTTHRLDAAARNEQPATPWPAEVQDLDEINEWMYRQNRDRPVDEVLRESETSFDRLAEVVQRFDEDELNDPDRVAWLKGSSLAETFRSGDMFGHYHEEHAEDVQAFLSRES